jgi:hypothetical protein
MACKVCTSDNQQKVPRRDERRFSPGINRVSLPAIYVSAVLLACLDCGHTDLLIPATKLERLKEGMDAVRFSGCVTDRSVIGD